MNYRYIVLAILLLFSCSKNEPGIPETLGASNNIEKPLNSLAKHKFNGYSEDDKINVSIFPPQYNFSVLSVANSLYLIDGVLPEYVLEEKKELDFGVQVWKSLDGITWSRLFKDLSKNPVSCIVYGANGKLIMVGGNDGGSEIWVSEDGVEWIELDNDLNNSDLISVKLYYYNDTYFLLGMSASDKEFDYKHALWYSDNLINWKRTITEVPFTSGEIIKMLTMKDRIIAYSTNEKMWESLDGINWSRINIAEPLIRFSGSSLVVFKDKIYSIGGYYAPEPEIFGTCNDVWVSSDYCKTWDLISPYDEDFTYEEASQAAARGWFETFPPRHGASAVVFNNKLYLIGGNAEESYDSKLCYNDTWVSDDGINWKKISQ